MVSRYELLVQFLNSLFYFGHWFNSLFYFSDQFNLSLYLIYQFKLSIQLTTLFQSPVIILNMNMMQPNLNRTEKTYHISTYHLCTILIISVQFCELELKLRKAMCGAAAANGQLQSSIHLKANYNTKITKTYATHTLILHSKYMYEYKAI